MKLFTKDIDNKLFKQYPLGNQLEKQKVVAKIFNPYGQGRWYLLNSDPVDPDYLWAIVQMGREVEIGSVSRKELESIRVSPFRFPLERDLGFSPVNAYELWRGLKDGKFYKDGGWVNNENKEMLENQSVEIDHHSDELEDILPKVKEVEPWVVAKAERAATDLSDLTHYLEGESEKQEMDEEVEEMSEEIDDFDRGGYMAYGGKMEVGRFYKDKQGDFFRFIGEGKFLNKSGEYVKKTIEDFYQDGGYMAEGGKIKNGKKIKYKGKEGRIISKKGDMYFVEIENYNPNGDSLHIVLREGEFDKMAEGGDVKFKDKVKSVKESLLKRKKVAKKVQKDYGKTYSPKEAEESAKRIVGAMTAKEKLKMRMAKKKK